MGGEARYKMSHSSEQRPETSNSQLNRITLSGLTDRALHRFVGRRGAGAAGARTERRVLNDGKNGGRRGLSFLV